MNKKLRKAVAAAEAARGIAQSAENARRVALRAENEARIEVALGRRAAAPEHFAPRDMRSVLVRRAPRLLDRRFEPALDRLSKLPAVRPLEDWVPRGKGCMTLFRSLAEHLLARFPVPAIVWNAFHDDNAGALVALAAHVAGGGSLFEYAKRDFAIPLTRKMCHEILATSSEHGFLDAIRRAQGRAAGVDARFFAAWRTTRFARDIGTKDEEAFWFTVLEWFSKVPMLEAAQVGPLFDYVAHRRREDEDFSMKGRSGPAVLRAMHEWHGNLSHERAIAATLFRRSGFSDADFNEQRYERDGAMVKEVWRVREILNTRTLADEGKRMGHCVYSYAWRIEKGDTSIWSVQMEDGCGETGRWHMVTVEVRNDLRRIVQVRGRFNRSANPKEVRVLRSWAGLNNLQIAT